MRSIGRDPIFVASGSGAELVDVDGRAYVDYVCSWGPLILGHAYPAVVEAVTAAAAHGTSFGAATAAEAELAEEIVARTPVEELAGVWVHEVSHLLRDHHGRGERYAREHQEHGPGERSEMGVPPAEGWGRTARVGRRRPAPHRFAPFLAPLRWLPQCPVADVRALLPTPPSGPAAPS